MKIEKREFQMKLQRTKHPENFIKSVIEPFQLKIENYQINVHVFKNFELEEQFIHGDWIKFKLVMFNLV